MLESVSLRTDDQRWTLNTLPADPGSFLHANPKTLVGWKIFDGTLVAGMRHLEAVLATSSESLRILVEWADGRHWAVGA
jgi:hypothetical protein